MKEVYKYKYRVYFVACIISLFRKSNSFVPALLEFHQNKEPDLRFSHPYHLPFLHSLNKYHYPFRLRPVRRSSCLTDSFLTRLKTEYLKKKSERAQTFWASPSQGEKMSKRLGGIIGCKYKTSSWHLNGFLYGSNIGSTVLSKLTFCGAPSLATSTPPLSILLPLALVPMFALSLVLPRPVVPHVPTGSCGQS